MLEAEPQQPDNQASGDLPEQKFYIQHILKFCFPALVWVAFLGNHSRTQLIPVQCRSFCVCRAGLSAMLILHMQTPAATEELCCSPTRIYLRCDAVNAPNPRPGPWVSDAVRSVRRAKVSFQMMRDSWRL